MTGAPDRPGVPVAPGTPARPDVPAQARVPAAVPDGYELDCDPRRVDRDAVWCFLSTQAYWGRWRERSHLDHQIDGAWRVVGAYRRDSGAQVGFARALSDGVALAYLADVYVLAEHRGRGLGAAIVRLMIEDGPGRDFRWMLHTADAHALYARFGFAPPDSSVLERPSRLGGPVPPRPGPRGGTGAPA